MNKRQKQQGIREAQRLIDAVKLLDDWLNNRPRSWLHFIGKDKDVTLPDYNDVARGLDAVKRDAIMLLFERMELRNNAEAIQAARHWNIGMFAGVTADREDLLNETADSILRGMAIQGMMWDETTKRWYSPEQEAQIAYYKKRYGSRWAAIYYDGAPEYDVEW